MRRTSRLVRAHARRRLSYWGRYLIKDIRKRGSVFKYREGKGRKRGGGGSLLASLRTHRVTGRRDPQQVITWGVPHGEVMEHGPRKAKRWLIVPKGFRSDYAGAGGRSGGGRALKFLRFKWHGKIKYARFVEHVWTPAELRPHIAPALKRHQRGFMADIGSIPKRVLEGKLT